MCFTVVKWLTSGIYNGIVVNLWDCYFYVYYCSVVVDLWDTCVGYCVVVVNQKTTVTYTRIPEISYTGLPEVNHYTTVTKQKLQRLTTTPQ